MFYDSLTPEEGYRLGATEATKIGCPIYPGANDPSWVEKRAEAELKEHCGLTPLHRIGTRVIVVEPKKEIVESIENGSFSKAISETWFRLIEKEQLKIVVRGGKGTTDVGLPDPYPLPTTETINAKTWLLGKDFERTVLPLATKENLRVKRFHAVHFDETIVAEDVRGITIIHNGMKIAALEPEFWPAVHRERLVGYVEFEREVDQELRRGENQDPNHYRLYWRRRIPKAIKDYVEDQLSEFGKKKLGLGKDPREIKKIRRSNAEDWAMRQLQKFAADLDLFASKKGIIPPPPPPLVDPPIKEVSVSITNFSYPDPDIAPRVNWGNRFDGIGLSCQNSSILEVGAQLSLRVLQGDRLVETLLNGLQVRLCKDKPIYQGPFGFEVAETNVPSPGLCRIKATLVDVKSGDRLDEVARQFWVETDPPFRSPFLLQGVQIPETSQFHKYQWVPSGSINSSPTINYNMAHPAYRSAEDEGRERFYLLDIVLDGAIHFILNRPPKQDNTPDFHPLDTGKIVGSGSKADLESAPHNTYQEIMKYVAEFRWSLHSTE